MSSKKRTISVVATNRADYAIILPVLRRIAADRSLRLQLIVAGKDLTTANGPGERAIKADGFPIAARVKIPLASDTPVGMSMSMGHATIGFAQAYARLRPDVLVVSGDRFEMHAAGVAALPLRIPVAHIEGGDLTEGAIDDALRHSLTKLSHLHFVSTKDSARRVIQLGEERWRVAVSGAPSLDTVLSAKLLGATELEKRYGISLEPSPLLITYHPVTLEHESTPRQLAELFGALATLKRPVLFTLPNADAGGREIARRIRAFASTRPWVRVLDTLDALGYLSLMAQAGAMVGNSSSGLIEAPSFGLPVVNIGIRQRGRTRAKNVIDVDCRREEIVRGVRRALKPRFRASLRGLANPYGSGRAAEKIVARLKGVSLDAALTIKKFHDIEVQQ
jgi:UDP-hydrolysing UDP-N-acetyl-D-glucosamine 2-epimerase